MFTLSSLTKVIKEIYRDVPGARIPGGSEDVMLDLAVRQLVRLYKEKTKALKAESRL